MSTTVESLCAGYPTEFYIYITYCRNLQFEETPDYTHLRRLFKDLFLREGYEYDYEFDWNALSNSNGRIQRPRPHIEEEKKISPARERSNTMGKITSSKQEKPIDRSKSVSSPENKAQEKKKSKCVIF